MKKKHPEGRRPLVPRQAFLTKGVGRHKDHLTSFEEALRDAGIACYNLVTVSSIWPPKCKLIAKKLGTGKLKPGEIVHCVMARTATEENARLIASSVGLAIPQERDRFGYLAEHHSYGQTDEEAGDYCEDQAASMLATVLGVPFDPNLAWNQKEEVFKISGKIIRTRNITQSAIGKSGVWTTVIAAAVFIP